MSSGVKMPLTDPTISNPVDPFRADPNSVDEFSIKVRVKRRTSDGGEMITIHSGKLSSDLESRAIGIQTASLNVVESIINLTIDPEYRGPAPPIVSKPQEMTFEAGDILVSWANRSDFVVLNGTASSRRVTFIPFGSMPETDTIANNDPFIKTYYGSQNNTSYDLTFQSDGSFTINGPYGNGSLVYSLNAASYRGNSLVRVEDPDTGIVVYKGQHYTDVGITCYPSPSGEMDVFDIASGVQGVIYDPNPGAAPINAVSFYNYLVESYTGSYQAKIRHLIGGLFPLLQGAVRHVINSKAHEAFSMRTGFMCMAEVCGAVVEVRLT